MKQYFYVFLLIILVLGCTQEKKYPYTISDFKPQLKIPIERILAIKQLLPGTDTLPGYLSKEHCTKEELIKLLNFDNPYMRIIAFRAIVDRNEPDYFPILLNHLDDTTKITWWYFDDAANDFMVSDLMIRKAVNETTINQYQKDSLVHEVLLKHTYLESAQWMMSEIKPQEKYYSVVKQAAQKKRTDCHDLINTYSLAKFNKQEDIPLIKQNFSEYTNNPYCNEYFFQSIIVFPDTAFYTLLTTYFETVIKKQRQESYADLEYYCLAVALYKNQTSSAILSALIKPETYPDTWYLKHNKEYVFRAIHKYPSPLYDSLYKVLRPQISDFVIKDLDRPEDKTTW